jgi:hypothetical protein
LAACENPARQGASFQASNGFLVYPLGDVTFEVIGRGSNGGSQYFCAAADYARVRLGQPPAARIVVSEPIGPSVNANAARSAKFKVVAPGSLRGTLGTLSVRRPGTNLNIAHARVLCNRTPPGIFGGL